MSFRMNQSLLLFVHFSRSLMSLRCIFFSSQHKHLGKYKSLMADSRSFLKLPIKAAQRRNMKVTLTVNTNYKKAQNFIAQAQTQFNLPFTNWIREVTGRVFGPEENLLYVVLLKSLWKTEEVHTRRQKKNPQKKAHHQTWTFLLWMKTPQGKTKQGQIEHFR